VALLTTQGIDAEAEVLDVADAAAVGAVAQTLLARHGRIGALVCSAGLDVPDRHWSSLTPEAFARVASINLNGVAFCITAVLPSMRSCGVAR
jgi:NAD(P)-dependent dehydrogenase (short-subunit alcohol dehydrogenase family)